jgi:hypothetical protein
MVAIFNPSENTVRLGDGIPLLESLYDDIRKPVFIDVIKNMSTKIGTYKKTGEVYIKTDEVCQNLAVLATLNIK